MRTLSDYVQPWLDALISDKYTQARRVLFGVPAHVPVDQGPIPPEACHYCASGVGLLPLGFRPVWNPELKYARLARHDESRSYYIFSALPPSSNTLRMWYDDMSPEDANHIESLNHIAIHLNDRRKWTFREIAHALYWCIYLNIRYTDVVPA